ncbi:hypothetical protein A1F94_011332 [Pyrenophora tritici-repentis]|nr:hypothetical protein A1F94_011332 [Pyrenophora tritici-repentis]
MKVANPVPNLCSFRTFGEAGYVHQPVQRRVQSAKFEPRSVKMYFVGREGSRIYLMWDPVTQSIHPDFDADIDNYNSLTEVANARATPQRRDTSQNAPRHDEISASFDARNILDGRRRITRPPNRYAAVSRCFATAITEATTTDLPPEPATRKAARLHPYSKQWIAAEDEELVSLDQNGTWETTTTIPPDEYSRQHALPRYTPLDTSVLKLKLRSPTDLATQQQIQNYQRLLASCCIQQQLRADISFHVAYLARAMSNQLNNTTSTQSRSSTISRPSNLL